MTKNNEPQDELKEALAGLSEKGDDLSSAGNSDAGASDLWAENKSSESVEEAFLALIQSNKQPEADTEPLLTDMPVEAEQPSAIGGAMQEDESSAFFAVNQSALEESLTDSLQPMQLDSAPQEVQSPVAFDTPPQTAMPEQTFSEFATGEVSSGSDADEKSLTEALSETIAQSLAEIQTGDPVQEELADLVQNDPIMQSVAMQTEQVMQQPSHVPVQEQPQMQQPPQPQMQQQQPQMLPPQPELQPQMPPVQQYSQMPPQAPVQNQAQQPPVLPEFPNNSNPLDKYPLDGPQQQTIPVQELISDMAAVSSSEIQVDNNTNDVMSQHHAYSNPFEIQKPQSAQEIPQASVSHMGNQAPEISHVAKMSAPVPVELAGTGSNKKSNADPEFQALVQWSNSDVEPSHHHGGPHDMPNFLSQKREEESKFSLKTVFISIGISVIVIGMFYVGYQAGNQGDTVVVQNPPEETRETIVGSNTGRNEANEMFQSGNTSGSGVTNNGRSQPRPAAPIKPEATITVFKVADLSGTAGRSIPMNIKLEGRNLGLETMLLLRGIPSQIELSKGIKRDGVWSVPISELSKLALMVPANYKGRFEFEVFAFKDKESGPEHRLASVSIDGLPQRIKRPVIEETIRVDPPQQRQRIDPEVKQETTTPPKAKNKKTQTINASVEASMLERANALLSNGDIAGARLVFEHVAVQGSKHAAFALGKTFDKAFLEKANIYGIVPDMERAKKWYKKASDMGHGAAAARLRQLGFAQ